MAISLSNTTAYTQNFNTLANTGTSNALPADWLIAESGTSANNNGQYTAGNGSGNGGDTYSFGATGAADRAIGGLRSGTFTPSFGASFANNTGSTITALNIAYTGERWRVGTANRADQLDFQYSTNATSLTTGTWTDFNALDFISPTGTTVGATDGNAAANRTAISGSIAGLSLANGSNVWIRWNDPDATGADDGLAVDDFSLIPVLSSGVSAGVTITETGGSTNVAEGGATDSYDIKLNTQPTSDVTVTLAATGSQLTFSVSTLTFTAANWDTAQTVTVSAVDDVLVEGLHTSNISHTIASTDSNYNNTVVPGITVAISDNDTAPPAITFIHDIQGSGTTFNTAFSGTRTIEGIVTRAFTGATKLNGFYVQEEDADADGNTATSEAIFVFDTSGTAVTVGDKVRVTGTVKEFTSATSSLTELDTAGVTTNIVNLGAGSLPNTINIQLPVVATTDLERYEGMLVNVSAANGNLTVTENFQLGRFGQIVLAVDGSSNQAGTDARLDQYTQFNAPSVSGYTSYQADIAKRRIYLDDGSGTQNLDPVLFGRNGNPLSATNTLRGGDAVANITGILDERFEGYRIQTSTGVNFTAENPRPTEAPEVGGTLKVANFNILNYFNDLNLTSATRFINDSGQSLQPRGANTAAEFTRQRDKIIQAIITSEADVLGLNEIENNGFGAGSAIQNLVDGLNAVAGVGTYAFVNPGVNISTDAITVGIIYKPGAVTPVGNAATIALGVSADFDGVGRRPLAQTFTQNSNQEQFTAVVNHFKSKGSSSGGVGDTDAGDGQGLSNGTRTRQAQALAAWLGTNPTGTTDPDYIILGDLNAYAQEDPLTALATAGYSNLFPATSYSYVFDGQVGSLDHALGNSSLAAQVTSAEKWHINADEPNVLDYNTEFKTAGQISSLYDSGVYRSSDHDPVIVGLNLRNKIEGTPLADILRGTSRNDDINGFSGNDVLLSGVGIDPNAGTDTLNGGAGNDDYGIYNSNTVINEANNEGIDSIWTAVDYTQPDNVEIMYLLGNLTGNGNNGNNIIVGYDVESHVIYGFGGDDTIIGGAGTDIIDGGNGADYLNGGLGNDDLQGGAGNDVLEGSGDDGGSDRFTGGAGDDAYGVYSLQTMVVEEADNGNDTVWTEINYSLTDNVENLSLVGNITGNGNARNNVILNYDDGNQTMNGLGGNDTIIGGGGNDTIDGGEGADYLSGGAGTDSFTFRFSQSSDTVTDQIADFAIGTDRIDIFGPAGVAAPTSFSRANDNDSTTLTALAQAVYADADGATSGNQALINGGAAIVVSTGVGIAGTYLIIDDGVSGFTSNDLVVNITGVTGTPALGSIAASSFFSSGSSQSS